MPIHNYRPVRDVTYTPPSALPLPLPGILALDLIESNQIQVEATDGQTHVNNAVPRARTTQVTIRTRDLASLRAVDRAAGGGVLSYTLIGLNGACDIAEQAALCYSRGIRVNGTVPQPYTCELTFDCVTENSYAIAPQS